MKALESLAVLAAAALRSSSDLPIFFWLRSRAACAFWTLDPFPILVLACCRLVEWLMDDGKVTSSLERMCERGVCGMSLLSCASLIVFVQKTPPITWIIWNTSVRRPK